MTFSESRLAGGKRGDATAAGEALGVKGVRGAWAS